MASVWVICDRRYATILNKWYSHAIRQIPPKAVCEPSGFGHSPCTKGKKTTELFGLGCPFLWRRKRDSNPRGFWPNGFQDRLVVTASIFLRIKLFLLAQPL